MSQTIEFLTHFGVSSVPGFWLPMLIWTMIAAGVLMVLHLYKNLHYSYQYTLRMAVLYSLPLGFVLLPLVSFTWVQPNQAELIRSAVSLRDVPVVVPVEVSIPQNTASLPTEQPKPELPFSFWIGLLTASVAALGLFRLIFFTTRFIGLQRFKSFLPQVVDEKVLGLIADLSVTLSINRKITVYSASDKNVPMTFGFFSPVIIVPSGLLNNESRLIPALTHECIHIAAKDYVFKFWEEILHNLFFFNPLVGVITSQIEKFREISCDAEVVSKSIISKADYARLLVEITTFSQSGKEFSLGVTFSNIKERILALQKHRKTESALLIKTTSVFGFLLFLVGFSLVLAGSRPGFATSAELTKEVFTLPDSLPEPFIKENTNSDSLRKNEIDGLWTGKMIQPEGPRGMDGYDMEIRLTHSGSNVFGTSKISIPNTDFLAVMVLTGSIENDSLFFNEGSYLENKPRPSYFWPLKTGVLVHDKKRGVLNGPWTGKNSAPGTIMVTKKSHDPQLSLKPKEKVPVKEPVFPYFSFVNLAVEIDGEDKVIPNGSILSSAFEFIFIGIKDFGYIVLHERPFTGAVYGGKIQGNKMEFNLDGHSISLISDSKIIESKPELDFWVKHITTFPETENILGSIPNVELLEVVNNVSISTQPVRNNNPVTNPDLKKSPDRPGDGTALPDISPEISGGMASLYKILKYPAEAVREQVEGTVVCRVTIDKDGNPISTEVLLSVHPAIDKAAQDALFKVKYIPGKTNGENVPAILTIPIKFKL